MIETTLLDIARQRGPDKTLCPSEVARAVAGDDPQRWRDLMIPVRKTAIRLALAGQVCLLRHGTPIDPTRLRGIYRIGLPRLD